MECGQLPAEYWWYAYYVNHVALGWPSDWAGVWNAIGPYLKNTQIMSCPSCTETTNYYTPDVGGNSRNTNYAYNGWFHARGLGTVSLPASTILVWEGIGTSGIDGVVSNPCFRFDVNAYSLWYGFAGEGNVHNEGLNYAFFDGHVKWLKTGSSAGAFTAIPGQPGWGVNWANFGWGTGLAPWT
jgi:prepilin-type processing-associated H-X9-DG protein